jgi:hypothetical protein
MKKTKKTKKTIKNKKSKNGGFFFNVNNEKTASKSDKDRFKKYKKEIDNIEKQKIPDYMFVNDKNNTINHAIVDIINSKLPKAGHADEEDDIYFPPPKIEKKLKWGDWLLLKYKDDDTFVYGISPYGYEYADIQLYKFGKNYDKDKDFNYFYEGNDGNAYISNSERTVTILDKKYIDYLLKELNIKIKKRSGPLISAKDSKIGDKKYGHDGNMWEVIKTKNGVQRWKKIPK